MSPKLPGQAREPGTGSHGIFQVEGRMGRAGILGRRVVLLFWMWEKEEPLDLVPPIVS